MADIIPLIFQHHASRPKKSDTYEQSASFSPSRLLNDIRYARACLSAWATRLVGDHAYFCVGKMARKTRTEAKSRRHLCATTNGRAKNTGVVKWEDVDFTMEGLANQYKAEDELLWYMTECFPASHKKGKVVIQVDAISSFITSRNRVSDSTARNALTTLTDVSLNALKEKVRDATARGETEYEKISDNVQRIDWEHMDNVTNLHFVRVLVDFSTRLNPLSFQVSARFRTALTKHRLKSQKKHLQPLSTNSEQQMENKGYQAGFRDFDEQMGIEPEKCDDLLSWNRADGGGHGMLMREKMIQVTTIKDVYVFYRNTISTPETWHTKSTKLNSTASNHYGPAASLDPSSLSRSSNAAHMRHPTDLKKCDFYPTSHSMTIIWEARVLDCWW
ncbi:hypothetical protein DFH09DRAFT_1430940 [Mycena vulgaris]|nr:hypothetical protein DFH09DRAFT_1430940 [Mycena vulgaris]